LTYEDDDRAAWAGRADGPARLNSFDVDALKDEQALKNDMIVVVNDRLSSTQLDS